MNEKTFEEMLKSAEEAMEIVRTHCIGCKKWVTEGGCSYRELIEPKAKICPKCGKPRYSKNNA